MKKLPELYTNLNDREKKLINLAALLVMVALLFSVLKYISFVFRPSFNVLSYNTKNEYLNLQPKVIELKKLQLLQQNFKHTDGADLFKFINDNPPKLATTDDEIPQINNVNNRVELKYNSVSFDDLVLWLGRLYKQYGVTLISVEIEKDVDKAGYVSATLLLE